MAKPKQTRKTAALRGRRATVAQEYDGVFLLKIVLYLILGSLWIKVSRGQSVTLPLPVGLIVGVAFAFHDHFQIDRKIEYAVLLVAMLIGFFAPFGLYIAIA
ncbi:MAG TPA: hypothetical protein VLG11_05955 [Candidatus Saccharimonadales bacterium]|nr:hypothetical protein [Candidatus Saccharimonadales bacterium]